MNIIKINDNSGKLFYIGGVVRDELLGRDSFDIDITYVGNAIEYCSKFGEVIQVNPDFGTVRVAAKLEEQRSGGQEGKPVNAAKQLSSQAAKLDNSKILQEQQPEKSSFPSGEGVRRTEGALLEDQRSGGQEDKLVNKSNLSEIIKEQQTDKNFSTIQFFNQKQPHPNPPHQGEGTCDDNPSTFQPFNLSTKNNLAAQLPSCLAAPIIDFASTRSESYPKKGHLPVVEKIGCSLKEDVLRRDFTINALAKSVTTGEIVDYTGGLEDLKNKKLRVLHDESFIDDPTRIIRGLKFSIRFGFDLEEHTKQLQDEYLANINYDMSYKRVKKELIETFNLNSQFAFEKFINEKIYKLVTPNDVELPKVNIEGLVKEYISEDKKNGWQEGKLVISSDICEISKEPQTDTSLPSCPPVLLPSVWLIYVGVLKDLSRLPLTKTEQKILDDVPQTDLKTDFEIYKAFENLRIESILLYAILKNEKVARHYLDDLRQIKIEITGNDLKNMGIPPSPKYQKIFDEVLKEKLQNPKMTKEDEIKYLKNLNNEL